MLYLRQKPTADGLTIRFKTLSFCVLLSCSLQAFAQADPEPVISDRLREEAARPMRWIIESSKLDRERNRKAAAEARAASRPRASANTKLETAETPETVRAAATPVQNPDMTPAPHASPTPSPAAKREARFAAAAPSPEPRATFPAQVYTAPLPPPVVVAAIKPTPSPPTASSTLLVPISQNDPDVWRGMCPDGCENYFYTVAFTVMQDGSVSNVRLVNSNFPRLKNAVVKAVSKWRYQPVAYNQEEEVTLRLAP